MQRVGGTKQVFSLKSQFQDDEQVGEKETDAKELDMLGDVSPCRDRCTRLWGGEGLSFILKLMEILVSV